MHGFFDPAGSADGSRKRRHRCCLPLIHERVGTPIVPISRLHNRPARTPYPTLRCALAGRQRMDGAIAIR